MTKYYVMFISSLLLSACACRNIGILEETRDKDGMIKQRTGYLKDGKPVLHGIQWDRRYRGSYSGTEYNDGILNQYRSILRSFISDPTLKELKKMRRKNPSRDDSD